MRGTSPQTPRTTETTKRLGLALERLSGLHRGSTHRGFTIVELLIVVVVIAILAAITIVAYNGITNSAKESALKSDLTTAAKKLNLEKVETGFFPGTYVATGLTYSGGGNEFCITGSTNGKSLQIDETGQIKEGDCPLPVATTMQTFTPAHCSALDTFTGSNSSAVVNLTDSRGGTTRTYEVAKLADGKCWMLTNLKLGSTSGSITLTPADSNVASNFTLPQLITSGATSYDDPQAIGPVPADTGVGATNYGYMYNWPAATAGETRSTIPMSNNDAPHSVCPANWRLPTGRSSISDFSRLDTALGGTGGWQQDSPAHLVTGWLNNGAFKGVLSGRWYGSFNSQGSNGYLWSASANGGSADSTFNVSFNSTSVSPGSGASSRFYGLGVRCLLN